MPQLNKQHQQKREAITSSKSKHETIVLVGIISYAN